MKRGAKEMTVVIMANNGQKLIGEHLGRCEIVALYLHLNFLRLRGRPLSHEYPYPKSVA
jgi:hypothetical protein